ncbi:MULTISPECIES: aspartate/glutamate racemase family protein [unclassified Chelatococcus]|uniref:aspartate/glutamate racemase family protein n=1 Tax=unclassified Chelatococcus TaxID=2638111 RepID=UPI001BCD6CF4|nr:MULTISPECIES: aspartate/glutamate racemase family protein [unclassified Chelatococcus]MBS7701354.1 hypothetical protein [Chelatococcus sp. YT9]MBX3557434.1 hypothetical protein [Chelatococcus sp.]
MTRIWHQSVNELDHISAYRAAISQHAANVLPMDVTVTVNGLASGTYGGKSPTEALGNSATYHRALSQIVDLAVEAERQGFDAFVIGSFSEPFLREARTAVDIPVVSMTEAALTTSCSLGRFAGLISNAPNVQWMARSSVEKHALASRVIEVASLEPPVDEFELASAYGNPQAIVANFRATAERLVAKGADVIVPAEGVLARLITGAGLSSVAGAPVLDVFAVAWRQAMMMADLWRTTDLRPGRAWTYRQ